MNLVGGTTTNYGTHTRENEWGVKEFCWKADQTDISEKIRVTGAGAGANSATIYVDDAELRVNEITNGSMESFQGGDPNIPTGWVNSLIPAGGMIKAGAGEADTTRHSGDFCAKWVNTANNRGIEQSVTLQANSCYTLSVWAKGDSGGEELKLVASGYSGGGFFSTSFILTTSWQKYSVSFSISTDTSGLIIIRSGSAITMYVDDIYMLKNDKAPATTDSKAAGNWPKTNPIYVG